jgi:hypothetical protein
MDLVDFPVIRMALSKTPAELPLEQFLYHIRIGYTLAGRHFNPSLFTQMVRTRPPHPSLPWLSYLQRACDLACAQRPNGGARQDG